MPREKRNEMPREIRDERTTTGGFRAADVRAAKGGYPPTPPRRLGKQDVDERVFLIATAHRPIAVRQKRKVLRERSTPLPPPRRPTRANRQTRRVLWGLWTSPTPP